MGDARPRMSCARSAGDRSRCRARPCDRRAAVGRGEETGDEGEGTSMKRNLAVIWAAIVAAGVTVVGVVTGRRRRARAERQKAREERQAKRAQRRAQGGRKRAGAVAARAGGRAGASAPAATSAAGRRRQHRRTHPRASRRRRPAPRARRPVRRRIAPPTRPRCRPVTAPVPNGPATTSRPSRASERSPKGSSGTLA